MQQHLYILDNIFKAIFTLLLFAPPHSSMLQREQLHPFYIVNLGMLLHFWGAAAPWLLWPSISEGKNELLQSKKRSTLPNFPNVKNDSEMPQMLQRHPLIASKLTSSIDEANGANKILTEMFGAVDGFTENNFVTVLVLVNPRIYSI